MKHLRIYKGKNEQGIVSLLVTIIIMAVLTITVVGFAMLMRREQRQTLDRQLNTQAFYAAEAGINDAIAYLNSKPPTDNIFKFKYDKCTGGNSFVSRAGLTSSIDPGNNVSYSCLLVDPLPKSLEFDNITDSPKVIPVVTPPPNKIDNITISWQDKDGSNNISCPGSGGSPVVFVPLGSWASGACHTGVIRVDVVPVNSVTRDDLNDYVRTLFLYPRNVGGTPPSQSIFKAAGSPTGLIVAATCTAGGSPRNCGATINVADFNGGSFYVRLSSLYVSSAVTIVADRSGPPLELTGAQAVIDSTGKANDILRRVLVHVSLNPLGKGPFPANALQSADTICKRLAFIPPPGAASTVTPAPSIADPTSACQLN